MTFTTGSGDYNAMMAGVLAHAVADGWTTSGGLWPISKGNVRGVDWTTFTATENDYTLLGGATKTARYIRIGVGTSLLNATANAGVTATAALLPNMEYSITSWYIYSDPSLCDYIHVAFNFSNGVNGDCWGHFGFGELDKHGMTHTAVVYATASPKRGYAEDTTSGISSKDWNGSLQSRSAHGYNGTVLGSFSPVLLGNSIVYIVDNTVAPIPSSGWPAMNTVQTDASVLDTLSLTNGALDTTAQSSYRTTKNFKWNSWSLLCYPQPYSGSITMGALPFILMQNLNVNAAQAVFLGSFPNVRSCCLSGYSPQEQVTYGSDTFDLYPVLRRTEYNLTHLQYAVTTGMAGYAHKRVV